MTETAAGAGAYGKPELTPQPLQPGTWPRKAKVGKPEDRDTRELKRTCSMRLVLEPPGWQAAGQTHVPKVRHLRPGS